MILAECEHSCVLLRPPLCALRSACSLCLLFFCALTSNVPTPTPPTLLSTHNNNIILSSISIDSPPPFPWRVFLGYPGCITPGIPPVSHRILVLVWYPPVRSPCIPVYRSISSHFAAEVRCTPLYLTVSSCICTYLALSSCIPLGSHHHHLENGYMTKNILQSPVASRHVDIRS